MSLQRLDLRGVPLAGLADRLPRPPAAEAFPTEVVRAVLDEVRGGGDEAVRALTKRFDGVDVDTLRVPAGEIEAALAGIDPALREALGVAYSRILAYHRHEPGPPPDFENDGVVIQHLLRPVARAGLYAPGGRARYPSTVLMCAAPARVAGVEELVLCVPPGPDGTVAAETLAAAAIAGIDEVYRVGGAQAVAAMAFGTESIGRVDVIAGPGNRYVAEAKRQVSGLVGVPSAFAGPSEVVVVADADTPVAWAAVDLVVQAEHGPDGLAWLVTWSAETADAVEAEVDRLVAASPRRSDLEATLGSGGYVALVDGPQEAVAVANVVAPEHLELLVARRRRRSSRWCGAPERCSSAPTPPPAWATTWPGPITCSPPLARRASRPPCGSTTSAPTSTWCRWTAPHWPAWHRTWSPSPRPKGCRRTPRR